MTSIPEIELAQNIYQQLAPIVYFDYKNSLINYSQTPFEQSSSIKYAQLITQIISQRFYKDQFVLPHTSTENISSLNRVWYINPFKGSGNFVSGVPLYFTTLSLWEHNQPQFTFIFDYFTHKYYWTQKTQTLIIEGEDKPLNTIQINKFTQDIDSQFQSSIHSDKYHKLIHQLTQKGHQFIKLPNSLGLIYTAINKYSAYYSGNFNDEITYRAAYHFITNNHGYITTYNPLPYQNYPTPLFAANSQHNYNEFLTLLDQIQPSTDI